MGYVTILSGYSGAGGSARDTGDLVFEPGLHAERMFNDWKGKCKNKKVMFYKLALLLF
jgi:hypothetical protein